MKTIRTTRRKEKGTYFCTMGMLNCYLFFLFMIIYYYREGYFYLLYVMDFFVILYHWACFF